MLACEQVCVHVLVGYSAHNLTFHFTLIPLIFAGAYVKSLDVAAGSICEAHIRLVGNSGILRSFPFI